jgi:hypothetical protein
VGVGRLDEAAAILAKGLASARQQGLIYDEALLLRATTRLDRAAGRTMSHETLAAMSATVAQLNLDRSAWTDDAVPVAS